LCWHHYLATIPLASLDALARAPLTSSDPAFGSMQWEYPHAAATFLSLRSPNFLFVFPFLVLGSCFLWRTLGKEDTTVAPSSTPFIIMAQCTLGICWFHIMGVVGLTLIHPLHSPAHLGSARGVPTCLGVGSGWNHRAKYNGNIGRYSIISDNLFLFLFFFWFASLALHLHIT